MPVGIGVGSRRASAVVVHLAVAAATLCVVAPVIAQTTPPPPLENPTGAVTLQDAAALALLHNPGLAAFAWEVRAREARALQAGRAPNPVLGVQAEDLGASPPAGINEPFPAQTTIQLSQLIELGAKRAARRDLAERDRELSTWDYETARIDVLTAVSRAITDVLAAQETVALTNHTMRVVEQVRQSVASRVTAGVASPIEETRAGVALGEVRIETARARRVLEAHRLQLALLWGSQLASFTEVVGDLKAEPAPLPAMSEVIARLEHSPDVARWAAEVSQREAMLALERSKSVPDVTVTAGYRRFTAGYGNALVVGASIPLPWFDRNRAGIEAARAGVAKAHEQQRSVHARVVAGVAAAYAAVAGAHDEQGILRTEILPGAEQAFAAVTEGYQLGRFGLLDVLDAQRTLIAAGRQYLQALSSYHQAAAELERLTGVSLAGGELATASQK